MDKPKLFKNENIRTTNTNKESCLLQNITDNTNDIDKELDIIFNSFNSIYNTRVIIVTKDKTYDTYLLSRTKNNIMTIKNEIIPIKDIINLKIK